MQGQAAPGTTLGQGPPAFLPLPLHRAWLTYAILGLNILLFLLLTLIARNGFFDALTGGADRATLVAFGAKENHAILAGEYWRFLTPVFLHIGMIHLLFNQYALYLFGREVEQLFGTLRFALIYLLAGVAGSVASFAFSAAVSAGASGAIFGIIGALTVFFLRNGEFLGEAGRQQMRSLLGLIGINLFLGFTIPGIDNYSHMGGLAAGLLLGAALAPTYTVEELPPPLFAQVMERPTPLPPLLVALLALGLLGAAAFLALPMAPLL
jgi:rhomboid protease GluP